MICFVTCRIDLSKTKCPWQCFVPYGDSSTLEKSNLFGDSRWSLTCDAGRRRTAKDDFSVQDFSIWRHWLLGFPYFYVIVYYFLSAFLALSPAVLDIFFVDNLFIKIKYRSYLFMNNFLWTLLTVGSVLLLTTSPYKINRVSIIFWSGENKPNCPPAKLFCQRDSCRIAVRNGYTIVVHNSLITFRNGYKIVVHNVSI